METSPDHKLSRADLAAVLVLTALAAATRLYKLDQGFWYDEIYSVSMFFRAPWPFLLTEMPAPNNHPFYSILAKLCILTLGEKEWTARLPAFIFGAFTPAMTYLFGARWLGRKAGLIGGAIVLLAMWQVWFSQDARGYSAEIFLTLASFYLFLSLMEKITAAKAAAYILLCALAVYSQLFALFAVLSHAAVGALAALAGRNPRNGLKWVSLSLAGAGLGLLLYFPMFSDMYSYASFQGKLTTGRSFTPSFLAKVFVGWGSGAGRLYLALPMMALAAAGLYPAMRRKWEVPVGWAAGLLLAFAFSIASQTFVFHRFYIFGAPCFYLFVGAALSKMIDSSRKPLKAASVMAIILIAAGLLADLSVYYGKGKQGYRDARDWVSLNAPWAKVVSMGLASDVYWYYDPSAVRLEKGETPEPSLLKGAAVVLSHWWSVGDYNMDILKFSCGQPKKFPSAGPPEYEVLVFICGDKNDGNR